MKSYFLSPVSPWDGVVASLTALLEREGETWLLKSSQGDPIAYFTIAKSDSTTGMPAIGADISGRHYNEDEAVLAILRKLQHDFGGEIAYAP